LWSETAEAGAGLTLSQWAQVLRPAVRAAVGALPRGIEFASGPDGEYSPLPQEILAVFLEQGPHLRLRLQWVDYCLIRYALPRGLQAAARSITAIARARGQPGS
jgi:hypothetical protein